jgi:hypothetical protein
MLHRFPQQRNEFQNLDLWCQFCTTTLVPILTRS